MEINKNNLAILKMGFEREISKNSTKYSTIQRYRSWIRRYIRFCLNLGLEINQDSALAFIKSYEIYTTRRQGYYAMKFLFNKILKVKMFKLCDTYKEERKKKHNYCKSRKYLFFR